LQPDVTDMIRCCRAEFHRRTFATVERGTCLLLMVLSSASNTLFITVFAHNRISE
ncbi:Hypothetical protein SMAX5B_001426, partial [Scophthalmus maximus]